MLDSSHEDKGMEIFLSWQLKGCLCTTLFGDTKELDLLTQIIGYLRVTVFSFTVGVQLPLKHGVREIS